MTLSWVAVVVGLSGVGKSTFSSFLASGLGASSVNSGVLLREYLLARNVEVDDDTATGAMFLNLYGECAAGEVIASGAIAADAKVIDGMRLYSSLDAFRRRGISPQIILLTTCPDLRHSRLMQRVLLKGGEGSSRTEAILRARDRWVDDLPRFDAITRWRFENSRSLDALRVFADQVTTELQMCPNG